MDTLPATVDAAVLRHRVGQLIDAGRTGAARPLLAAARSLSPDNAPDIALLTARLNRCDGDPGRAMEVLTKAIAQAPADRGLRKCRSELARETGDFDRAARDAAEAVILDREDPVAKALLGDALMALGRIVQAVACLTDAVAGAPAAVAPREALANALDKAGSPQAALRVLTEGMAIVPGSVALRNAAMLLLMRSRDFAGVVRLAEQTRVLGIADACTFGMKGHALASLGDHDEAAIAYQEALKLGPDDPYVRHLVMAAGGMPSGKRAPVEYVKAVFDGYADHFEAHLSSLGYNMPARVRKALEAHPKIAAGSPPGLGPVLDLGCGTGLVAAAISGLALGPISGVDLSPRMLDQARAKNHYAELREADIMDALDGADTRRWPLIVASDVLIYFGELEALFAAVHARLEPGGWFVFTVEELLADRDGVVPGNGSWALYRLGRYTHTPDYVHQVVSAAGFRAVRNERLSLRQEAGADVPGMLIAIERLRHGG